MYQKKNIKSKVKFDKEIDYYDPPKRYLESQKQHYAPKAQMKFSHAKEQGFLQIIYVIYKYFDNGF